MIFLLQLPEGFYVRFELLAIFVVKQHKPINDKSEIPWSGSGKS